MLHLIDSEVVLGKFAKGYYAQEDTCELVGVSWDLGLEFRGSVYMD